MARVLIVLDGSYRFTAAGGPPDADFTYTSLVGALESANHNVTKAHRQSDSSADLESFNFDDAGIDLRDFDVLWLIGNSGRNVPVGSSTALPETEVAAIARFMAEGGGVFATGDHDSIGSNMCGHIPRVRAMRSWYGEDDPVSPMPADFPFNFPPFGADRADSTLQNPDGDYGGSTEFVWFENQSDSVPQAITPTTSPAHPILRRGDAEIVVFPDHMHEGKTHGEIDYDYELTLDFDGESFVEFPEVDGNRELPSVIATGLSLAHSSRKAAPEDSELDPVVADARPINTLSVYDGRDVGVGRIVTGSTFHHYIDINLTGDTDIVTAEQKARTGPDAEKEHGFNDDPEVFANIKAAFGNITVWLARPRPRIELILERSTFSQAEALDNPDFNGAILVRVHGLKPNQFPGGGITSLASAAFQVAWAPTITPPVEPAGLNIVPTGVASDDPDLNDRLQAITFTYRVEVTAAAAFGFPDDFNHVQVNATLISPSVSNDLTNSAQITLVKSANPFMLDQVGDNTTPWLSSDVKVFPVVAGGPGSGLVNEASRGQALDFLRTRLTAMTDDEFDNELSGNQAASALSPYPRTTESDRKVYNFAVARVRLPAASPSADDVRVFFRIFTSQTTAALTFNESRGYKKTPSPTPIALPGTNAGNTEWLSFPMFLAPRAATPEGQADLDNVKDIPPGETRFFGCLIDNNLNDPYLPLTPPFDSGAATDLPTLMMGEHQCIVAQIEFPGTPIPSGANPFTSDKLSQRNIALSSIANPGLDASRMALHTFEIEATPHAISDGSPPDELLLQWHNEPPEGTEVRLEISTWDSRGVVELADSFYPRHEIRALDARTIAIAGGGVRYVPITRSQRRQTGIVAVHFPLGVKRGQRYDLSVRQVTTRGRQVAPPPPKTTVISRVEAARLLEDRAGPPPATNVPAKRGVFELGKNRVLITDLSVIDGDGDHALIVEHPDRATIAAAARQSGRWRETIGAFQLGIPVLVKVDMLAHHLRLVSVLRWRAEWLRPNNRWYDTFIRYVELSAEKVRALGGDPYSVPPTPDGNIPLPGKDKDHVGCLACIFLAIRRRLRGH